MITKDVRTPVIKGSERTVEEQIRYVIGRGKAQRKEVIRKSKDTKGKPR